MPERPYSTYTRAKTWAALYCQHINACYALVPHSVTNNSIAVIRCKSPEETHDMMRILLEHASECEDFYGQRLTPDKAPPFLTRARHAVVLARSSDYYHYHLSDHTEFSLVICGLHDSYLHLPVWETSTNTRYSARETAVAITSPDFDRIRRTQFGHHILIGALAAGNKDALAFIERKEFPARTRRRLKQEVRRLQEKRYRGRPLAFLTDAERREIGNKIREGLRRYYERKQAL
jgi:hypothetical protein